MWTHKQTLLLVMCSLAASFCAFWAWELTRRGGWRWPTPYKILVGVITNFFDTLGIGSFATTALYRPWHVVADENLPGTLTVGHILPTVTQAVIYISIIKVEFTTLASMIAASVLGAWLGAGVVTRLPRRWVQVGMGAALLVAVAIMVVRLLGAYPRSELVVLAAELCAACTQPDAGTPLRVSVAPLLSSLGEGPVIGLDWGMLGVAVACNFVIGALMTIGVGAYAPILILVSLLGMYEKTAFPIMMGSCAFLMPVSGVRFIRAGRYDPRAALGLTLGGIPAVLVAAFIVKELPLEYVKWGVVGIVVWTAATMLHSAYRERQPVA